MSDKIRELKESREAVVTQQRELIDLADNESRDFTPEEQESYNKMESDFDKFDIEIRDAETAEEARVARVAKQEKREDDIKKTVRDTPPQVQKEDRKIEKMIAMSVGERYQDAFEGYRTQTGGKFATKEYRDMFNRALGCGLSQPEMRALQADSDTAGGYLVTPEQFIAKLIQAVDNMVYVRGLATVIPVPNAASLGAPALENDMGDPTWTAEIKTGAEDSTLDFAKRDLHPHPLARRIKVSEPLMRKALLSVDGIVRERLAYKFAVVMENAYINGTGSNQPLGFMVASDWGIGTGQDVSTGNTITAFTADGLINAQMNLKLQYRNSPNTRWMFHREGVTMARKLKDGNGEYLWQSGLRDGTPASILGTPYVESEYMPHVFTTGLYVGIIGDFRHYWIADALNMQVKVLNELYAEANQIGYIGRMESDGMPVLAEAFTRVTIG